MIRRLLEPPSFWWALTLILLAVMLVDWIRNGVDADALVGAAIVAAAMAYRRWARRRDEPDREA